LPLESFVTQWRELLACFEMESSGLGCIAAELN
jgi:hypothetical protein